MVTKTIAQLIAEIEDLRKEKFDLEFKNVASIKEAAMKKVSEEVEQEAQNEIDRLRKELNEAQDALAQTDANDDDEVAKRSANVAELTAQLQAAQDIAEAIPQQRSELEKSHAEIVQRLEQLEGEIVTKELELTQAKKSVPTKKKSVKKKASTTNSKTVWDWFQVAAVISLIMSMGYGGYALRSLAASLSEGGQSEIKSLRSEIEKVKADTAKKDAELAKQAKETETKAKEALTRASIGVGLSNINKWDQSALQFIIGQPPYEFKTNIVEDAGEDEPLDWANAEALPPREE